MYEKVLERLVLAERRLQSLEADLSAKSIELQTLRKQADTLARRTHSVENVVESTIWDTSLHRLDQPTITKAIIDVSANYWGFTKEEIKGERMLGDGRGAGYSARTKTSYDEQLTTARRWMTLLLRYCCQIEQKTIWHEYRWCSVRMFTEMGIHYREMHKNPLHPDREMWSQLLSLVIERGQQIGANTYQAEHELKLTTA